MQPLRLAIVAAAALVALTAPRDAAAIQIRADGAQSDDMFVKLDFFTQAWVVFSSDPLSDTALGSDFLVRRARLILTGQVSERVGFFFVTDSPNWGRGGNWTPDFYVLDAFVTFDFGDALKLDAGILLPPFVHHARQGSINLHTLDFHAELVKYPKPNKAWHDAGVEVRGLLLDKRLDYRLAVMNGKVGPVDDIPRTTGRVGWNAFDAEEGPFFGGTYLGAKKVLSLGLAFDVQPDIVDGGGTYYALGGDVFWDIPLGLDRCSGQLDVVYYHGVDGKKVVVDDGGVATSVDALLDTSAFGLLFDVGYAFGVWEPIVAVDWLRPDGAAGLTDQLLGLHLGLNWWFQGHAANLKLDLGWVKAAGRAPADAARTLVVQSQVYF